MKISANDIMSKIDEAETDEFMKNYLGEQEEKRWKNEDRFNKFLDFLIKFIDKNKRVLSDDFYYEEEKCKPYTFREFESYLMSLYDIVDNYAQKNLIFDRFSTADENIFSEKSYCLKIKEKFYRIELVVGQGSFVSLELVNDNNNYSYADYNLIIMDKQSPFYENNLKEKIYLNLNNMVEELIEDGANKELVEDFIKEYFK